jgi:hypothetical protein
MELAFDSEKNCTYSGPSEVKTGPVTLIFRNDSGGRAAVNLMRHLRGETIQDMIDYLGPEPSSKQQPPWVIDLSTWQVIRSGRVYSWEGVLKPGIHTMVCGSASYGIWFGAGLTVEE